MPDEQKTQLRLEIAHVRFMDIVGYSKLLIDEQSEALQELNEIVRKTEAGRGAETAGQLIILPTGDGMALVFTGSVEDPVECALQISQRLRAQPSLPVRMGIHSGPVHHVADVNQRENIAGAGINIAKRSPILVTLFVVGFMLFTLAVLGIIFAPAILKQMQARQTTVPAPAASTAPSVASIPEKSIAVLPFENLSDEKQNAYFADGVQ